MTHLQLVRAVDLQPRAAQHAGWPLKRSVICSTTFAHLLKNCFSRFAHGLITTSALVDVVISRTLQMTR